MVWGSLLLIMPHRNIKRCPNCKHKEAVRIHKKEKWFQCLNCGRDYIYKDNKLKDYYE